MSLAVLAIATVIIVTIYVAVRVIGARCRRRIEELQAEWRSDFAERFPPISDDEFMARCRSGTRPEIALKVRRTLSDCLGIDYERIYPESQLVRDLGAE